MIQVKDIITRPIPQNRKEIETKEIKNYLNHLSNLNCLKNEKIEYNDCDFFEEFKYNDVFFENVFNFLVNNDRYEYAYKILKNEAEKIIDSEVDNILDDSNQFFDLYFDAFNKKVFMLNNSQKRVLWEREESKIFRNSDSVFEVFTKVNYKLKIPTIPELNEIAEENDMKFHTYEFFDFLHFYGICDLRDFFLFCCFDFKKIYFPKVSLKKKFNDFIVGEFNEKLTKKTIELFEELGNDLLNKFTDELFEKYGD